MKNRIVSLFIASVLAISNIGFCSDVQPAYALEPESADLSGEEEEEAVDAEDVESYEETESDSVSAPADVKIISFGELPEDVVYQEVKAGTTLDEINFPDTLQIDVVPDPDREERINRKLGEERQKERESSLDEEEDDAGEDASSEDEDAASEASSDDLTDPDEDEIIFFESDEEDDSTGETGDDNDDEENDNNDESSEERGDDSDRNDDSSDTVITEPENTEEPESTEEPENTSAPENTEESTPAEDLVGWIRSAFKSLTVYAAEDAEDTDDSDDSEEAAPEEPSDAEAEDDGVSHEFVSEVKWLLDPESNDTDEYDPDLVGAEYVFIPVLLIPDFYYIEAELPTITVMILEDNFAFDETVEVDGVKIRVRAEKGVFPEGSKIHAEKLEDEEEQTVQEAVRESEEEQGFVVKSYSFDIQILDEDEKEIEPDTEKGKVIVSFETEEADNELLHSDIYHISDEEEVEKLNAVVVDGEENKAVEAVTDGFSMYTLVFTWEEYEIEWPGDKSYVCLDDAFINNGYLEDSLVIEEPDSDIRYDSASDSDFFYFARLKSTVSTYGDNNVMHTPVVSEGCFEEPDLGSDAAWFIILRKPFVGKTKKVTVICDRDGTESTIKLNITGNEAVEASYVHEYPYGLVPGGTDFVLKVSTDPEVDGVVYQWQYKKKSGNSNSWNNIDLANSAVFGGSFDDAPYEPGDWFRCLMNGNASKAVQIISAASDTASRIWTGPYQGDVNRFYVSNGTVAYTVDSDSGRTIIDVVGQFSKGGRAYMVQTTRDGNGWTIITDTDASPASGSFDSGAADLEDLYLGFSEAAPLQLKVEADLGDTAQALAIGTDCAIGNSDIKDNVPIAGTLIADLDFQRNISKVSYIGISSRDAAQNAMNRDQGTDYPAVSLIPVTTHGLKVWINNTGTAEPYRFADGNSTVKVDGQEIANVKLLSENSASNEAVSWNDATAGSIVSFNFEIGSLATATSFKNVKDARYEYTANSSNIKNGRLLGDELRKYAITVAEPMDSVLELLKIKTPSSVKSTLSSKVKSLTSSSSSSSSNSYKADYLDISILQTSDNATYNNKNVTEVRKDSKDASSAAMPLKIELTYDFSNKETIRLFREHGGSVIELTESSSGNDGTYTLNRDAGKIYVYSYKFSQFAVLYKQEVYYTVTFDDGTSKSYVKVKAGEKVSRPEDPTKESYVFKGWYLRGSSSTASAFNFDTAITKDITLVAGWTSSKDKKSGTDDSDENGSRAPKTGDSLPAVWLWVIVLAAGIVTFSISLKEIINSEKQEGEREKTPTGLERAFLLLGILIVTTAKFIARKIQQNKAKALLTASGAVVIVSLIVLVSTMLQYKTAEDLYIDAEETYVETAEEEFSVEQTEETAPEVVHGWWDCVDVNVQELAQEYPDVVGWIYFENEDISYPIMYSGDNAKYLSTAYTGEKAKAGAIFIDGESTPDFSDPHSLVYGHNMRDLSMFGKLRYYKNTPGYYEDHQYFQVFTKDSVYRYQIFACEVVPDNHDVFWVYGKEPTDYWKMLKEVERDSFINTDIRANESDHVITLATCTNNDDERLIVCAVRTDAYQYQQ